MLPCALPALELGSRECAKLSDFDAGPICNSAGCLGEWLLFVRITNINTITQGGLDVLYTMHIICEFLNLNAKSLKPFRNSLLGQHDDTSVSMWSIVNGVRDRAREKSRRPHNLHLFLADCYSRTQIRGALYASLNNSSSYVSYFYLLLLFCESSL